MLLNIYILFISIEDTYRLNFKFLTELITVYNSLELHITAYNSCMDSLSTAHYRVYKGKDTRFATTTPKRRC